MNDEISKIELKNKKNLFKINKDKVKRYTNLVLNPTKLLEKIFNKFFKKDITKSQNSFNYEELYRQYGQNAVIDHRHPYEQFEYVTKRQKEILFPILRAQVKKPIDKILDFGCGIGRFSKDLAEIFDCSVTGVDTSKYLIDLCKEEKDVSFIAVDEEFSQIKEKFDLIFICHVINGIPDQKVFKLAEILSSKLDKSGKLFLVEVTGKSNVENTWRTRTVEKIINFFPKVDLKYISQYIDIDNQVSIFCGQKK